MLSTRHRPSTFRAPTRIIAMPPPLWLSVVRVVTWSRKSRTVARSPASEVTPLETEDPPRPQRRGVDLAALVPGLFFVVLAVVLMAGAVLPLGLVTEGGLLWLVLIGGGVALLVSELRRARRRR